MVQKYLEHSRFSSTCKLKFYPTWMIPCQGTITRNDLNELISEISSSSKSLWFFGCKSLNFFCLFPFLFKGAILSFLFQPSIYKEVQNPFLFYVSSILQAKRMTILIEFIINLNTVRTWLCAAKVKCQEL